MLTETIGFYRKYTKLIRCLEVRDEKIQFAGKRASMRGAEEAPLNAMRSAVRMTGTVPT